MSENSNVLRQQGFRVRLLSSQGNFQDTQCFGGESGNFNLDPLFGDIDACGQPFCCDATFCLAAGSPMLPENSPGDCGQIGAQGLCATTA